MQRRNFVFSTIAAAISASAYSQQVSTIKYIVPFPAGGLTDQMARNVGKALSESLKVPVITENKAGANAQLGAQFVAKGPADGSHLLAITLTHAANATLFPNAQYNFKNDLRPVALLAASPMIVVVPTDSPIRTFKDLTTVAKTGKLSAGSSGNGSPPHLSMALFNQLNSSTMNHVPYKGGAPCMQDLVGGHIDVVFANYPECIQHVKSGKLRPLAICSLGRDSTLPDVPTALEVGFSGLFVENWTAVMVQAKTPDDVVNRYAREILKSLYSQDMEKRARAQGFRITPKIGNELDDFINTEVGRWRRLIRTAKIVAT